MKLTVELQEEEIRKILADYINEKFAVDFLPKEIPIEVKSKQNYRSVWEIADIRIIFDIVR
jgi:hypothetical protein